MAAISLFWYTNMAAVTSDENDLQRVSKKTQPRNFLRNTLQFLSIKDFRPLGIEIELLIDHITVVVH